MNDSKIAVRYARALYLAAEGNKVLTEVSDDVRQLTVLCRESEDFTIFLQSSVIRKSVKKSLMQQLFEPHFHPLTLRFLYLLADNRRESKLPVICIDFMDVIREKQGISPVVITTASGLLPEIRDDIRRLLEQKTGKTIELTEKIRPEILGGLILRIGDLQYDGSISHQLRKIKESLLGKELSEFKF